MGEFLDKYGPWAVIAGGSDGIGAAFTRELAARGFNVLTSARGKDTLDALAAEVRRDSPGVEIRTLPIDLAREDSIAEFEAATAGLDVGCFIYNVGSEPKYGPFLDHDWEMLQGRLQRNFVTKTALTHHYGRLMRARGGGAIILMGSMSGFFGNPGFALYSASKAFTRFLAEALWYEFKQYGIDLISPVVGPTDTPTMVNAYGKLQNAMDARDVAQASLDALGKGCLWIADDISGQIEKISAMSPEKRAELTGKIAEAFTSTGKMPSIEEVGG